MHFAQFPPQFHERHVMKMKQDKGNEKKTKNQQPETLNERMNEWIRIWPDANYNLLSCIPIGEADVEFKTKLSARGFNDAQISGLQQPSALLSSLEDYVRNVFTRYVHQPSHLVCPRFSILHLRFHDCNLVSLFHVDNGSASIVSVFDFTSISIFCFSFYTAFHRMHKTNCRKKAERWRTRRRRKRRRSHRKSKWCNTKSPTSISWWITVIWRNCQAMAAATVVSIMVVSCTTWADYTRKNTVEALEVCLGGLRHPLFYLALVLLNNG